MKETTPEMVNPITKLLLVDDDTELCTLTAEFLEARGLSVDVEGDGGQAVQRIHDSDYACIVLDVMLPTLDGFEVLRRVRAGGGPGASVPVVMLTAHGDEVDRIVGLEMGADDYLPKPFNPRELLARIRAILRRSAPNALGAHVGSEIDAQFSPEMEEPVAGATVPATEYLEEAGILRLDDLELDPGARTVVRNGEDIELTATEFDLLQALLKSAGHVVRRDDLAQEALDRRLLPFDRSLDLHISKLRRKLGPTPSGQDRIRTLRGVGYLFVKPKA